MKINRIHINSFGKLRNRTFAFSDGIHVIQGPNESGKSTLHAFLEAMYFGLERGRGRAAKSDNYTRYYPEEGGSTYGGVMEFTQDETMYSVYRNFTRDPAGLTLMDETHGKQLSPDPEEYRQILGGLTLPLYRNTVSLKQLQAKTSDELPGLLKNHIINLKQAGSASLDLKKSKERLLREKKSLLQSMQAGAEKEAALLSLQIREEETAISALPDPSELSQKKEDAVRINEDLERDSKARQELLSEIHACENEVQDRTEEAANYASGSRMIAGGGILLILAAVLMFFASLKIPAALCAVAGILMAAAAALYSGKAKALRADGGDTESLSQLRAEEEALTTGLLGKQQMLKTLEHESSELARGLYKREECEERKRQAEEKLEALSPAIERNQALKAECEAIDLAIATIDELSGNVFDSFGRYLTDTASDLIRQITGGRYTRLLMDENMELSLEHEHQPVSISTVSVSTIDQVYLALRIACIEFFWPEESMPLLLDESFAMYDTARITETLSWLAESYPGQIFLFTAQSREEEILDSCRIRHQTIRL